MIGMRAADRPSRYYIIQEVLNMGCCNNSWGGNSCLWIILLIIILFGCGGNSCGCGCNNNCGCNNGCGC